MSKSMIDALIKSSKSEFTSSVFDGIPDYDPTVPCIDTGSYSFNALLTGSIYGGFIPNKVGLVAGSPATGKTWYAFAFAKSFLEANTGEYDRVFYFESEKAITQDMFYNYGFGEDTKRVQIFEVDTVEDFRNQATRIVVDYLKMKADLEAKNKKLKKGVEPTQMPKLCFILDSLGQLTTEWELENAVSGKNKADMGKRAQLIRGTFRPLTIKLGRAGITMFVTNHTYDSMEMFSGKKMGGGDGAVYAGSTIVYLSKQGFKEGGEKAGNIIHVTLQKGRFTVEGKKVETKLYFGRGLDRYWGLLPIAEKYGLVQLKAGSKTQYMFPNDKGEFKVGGKLVNDAHLQEWYCDPSRAEEWFTPEFLNKVDAVCKKEFLYGSKQEQLAAIAAREALIAAEEAADEEKK